jgi:hypothetical protein
MAEIDSRIAAVRENFRELVEQAAAYSGAALARKVLTLPTNSDASTKRSCSPSITALEGNGCAFVRTR